MFSLPAVTSVAIGTVDALIVAAYLVGTVALGIWLGRGQKNNRDYFLGGHQLPTWSLLLSIVATETSTVTFLSVPGKSYVEGGNFTFLQLAFGYIVGRFAIIVLLLPGYFRGEMLSAYQVLEQRFGLTTRRLASLVFLVTRNLADGLRLFLSAWALNIAIGLDFLTCIIAMTIITAIYSLRRRRAVGRLERLHSVRRVHGRRDLPRCGSSLTLLPERLVADLCEFGQRHRPLAAIRFRSVADEAGHHVLVGLLGGAFLSLATHGVDQMIVQRYLCAKDQSVGELGAGSERICRVRSICAFSC